MAMFLLILVTAISIYLLVRGDIFNPATVFGMSATLSAWTFYLVGIEGHHPHFVDAWWHFQYSYRPVLTSVLAIYLIQSGMALGVQWLTDNVSSTESPSGELASWSATNAEQLEQYLAGPVALGAMAGLFGICVWHFLSIDLDRVICYREYLAIRNPEFAGLSGGVLRTFHVFLPQLGCLLAVLTTYCFCRGFRPLCWLSLLPTLYVMLITAAYVSRAIVAQLGLVWLVWNLSASTPRRWWRVALIVVPIMMYCALIALRHEQGNEGRYGVEPLFEIIIDGRFWLSDAFFTVAFNLFGGGFGVGHAMLHEGVLEHTLRYKLHSFFPGPSLIDGFASFRDLDELRPHPNAPYGAFAEAYLFGKAYLAFYCAVVFFVLWSVSRFWRRYRWGPGIAVACLSYLTFFYIQTYQIRNSFRMLVGVALFAWAFDWFIQWKMAAGEKSAASAPTDAGPDESRAIPSQS
jgi:hypothetical protein